MKKIFSVLLATFLIMTMSTSVFALRSDDAAFDTVAFGPLDCSGFALDTALTTSANLQVGSSADVKAVTDANADYGSVLAFRNWYTNDGNNNNDGSGKYISIPKYAGAATYEELKVEFDLKVDLGNRITIMGTYDGTNASIKDRYGLFTVTSARKVVAYNSSTALATLNDGWNHFVIYLNVNSGIFTVYANDALVIHNTTTLKNEAYNGFKGLIVYDESMKNTTNITTDEMVAGVYAYVDNVKFTSRTTPEDVTAYNMPEYYPEDMNSFISFNGMTYADQSVGTTALKTGNGISGSIVNDSANFYVPESGKIVGATLHPHSEGSNDKFLRIYGSNDHSYLMYKLNGDSGIKFKTINSQEVDDGNGGTTTEYLDPTYSDDARYLYFTAKVGGLMDYWNNSSMKDDASKKPRFYMSTDIYNAAEGKHIDGGGAFMYFTEGKIRSTAAYAFRQVDVNKEADKFYKIDVIYDMHTGIYRTYADGKFLREFEDENVIARYASNKDYSKLTRIRIQLYPRAVEPSQIDIDNIGYKVYSKYVDEEKTTERTLSDVLADVFGKPELKYSEIIAADSTKAELKVLARAQGLKANGNAAGYVAIVAKDGDKITNISFAPTSAGAQFEATFTENLAETDKIVTYYFGDNMTNLADPIVVNYNNAEYPDPEPEEEPAE